MAMQWQTLQIPLAQGMTQKADERALPPPALAVVKDAVFDDTGGVQTRAPYKPFIGAQYLIPGGGGSTATMPDVRRLVANGDELLAFTKDRLYSWYAARGLWVDKGEHPAVAVDETPIFETTSDQTQCDRAEVDNTIFYCWRDEADPSDPSHGPVLGPGGAPPAANAGAVYVAAIDKVTGAVILPPTEIDGEARPRLVALPHWHYVLLFTINASTGDFLFRQLTPGNGELDVDVGTPPTTLVLGTTITATRPSTCAFDVCLLDGTSPSGATAIWVYTRADGTVYTLGKVTGSTATGTTLATKSRFCDSATAIASAPDGSAVMIVRTQDSAIYGDVITLPAVTDLYSTVQLNIGAAAALAAPCAQIAVAYSDGVHSPNYLPSIWWTPILLAGNADEGESYPVTGYNTFPYTAASGPTGTPILFMRNVAVASRAFCRAGNGHVFVHLVFAEFNRVAQGRFAQLQNTYFLYRDDGRLCGQVAADVAGGFDSSDTYESIVSHLPGVARIDTTDAYAWCAQRRRRIPLAGTFDSVYSARAPLDASVSFDDARARRAVRLGETLYVTGAEVLQYDGEQLVECGFHLYPWRVRPELEDNTTDIPAGSYTYKSTFRWDNARGERERSTTAVYRTLATGTPGDIEVTVAELGITHKTDARSPIVIEIWRTKANPGSVEDPMYLVTSQDPNQARAPFNRFVANVPANASATVDDTLTDEDLEEVEESEEVGSVLESLAPPPCSVIAASPDRIFLGGIAGDPHRVWYSKYRAVGQVAAFDDELTIDIPHPGGAITAIALLQETLVVFRASAIYVVPGEGLDNTGGGQNYGPARCVSPDTGALAPEVVALTALGLVFKSAKGWYLLTPNGVPQYIGAPIADYDAEEVIATHVIESNHQVRIVTGQRVLVWDYLVNQWSEWSEGLASAACVWQGQHAYWSLFDQNWRLEQLDDPTFSYAGYGLDVETPWIKLNDLGGRGRVRRLLITGEWRSAHKLRIRVARDYAHGAGGDPAWFDDVLWSPSSTVPGDPEQVRHGPSIQRCGAIKVRITAVGAASSLPFGIVDAVSGEGMRLTGLGLEVGVEPGLKLNLSAAQKG